MRLEFAAHSEIGRREKNEDSIAAERTLGLFAVADGLGGYHGGEIASRLAATTLLEVFAQEKSGGAAPEGPLAATKRRMATAFRRAHEAILSHQVGPLINMATTLSALRLHEDVGVIGHVGDSRIYRLHSGRLDRLTQDHRLFPELPFRNVLSRALGVGDESRCDILATPVEKGDTFLLCTDGLSDYVDDDTMRAILDTEQHPSKACRALTDAAFENGSTDNVTAIVVMVGGG